MLLSVRAHNAYERLLGMLEATSVRVWRFCIRPCILCSGFIHIRSLARGHPLSKPPTLFPISMASSLTLTVPDLLLPMLRAGRSNLCLQPM